LLRDLALNSHKGAIMFVRQVDELFGDLLLEIKLRVKPLKGIERSLKRLQSLRVFLRRIARKLCVILSNRIAQFFDLLTQARQDFHVTLATLDLLDRKSTRLNSSHRTISYAVFCLKKKNFASYLTDGDCVPDDQN